MTTRFGSQSLGSIVAADFRAAAVFDRFGLDFCCGGKRTLSEACEQRGMVVEQVETALDALGTGGTVDVPNESWSADELTRYIERRHHTFVREQTLVIDARLDKLVKVHGRAHPELVTAAEHFGDLASELLMHLKKEEEILFPYVRALASASERGTGAPPNMFGTVRNPIRMMESEHQDAGRELEQLRSITSNFTVPADGCATYRACYEELEAFDRDLRMHIHLENNVLFPKAVALEAALQR
ncbi:MAG: iron-sulfur cluster repair di-iron protein [Vicinamibacterales bacterium]